MEEENNWIEQLKIMQLNIMSLFQGIIKERDNFKEGNDMLTASIKEMISRIDTLQRQNDILQKCNATLRNIFGVGVKTFKKLDLSSVNSIKDNKVSLELLQKLFLESSVKIEPNNDASSAGEKSNSGSCTVRAQTDAETIIKKCSFETSHDPTISTKNEDESERKTQLVLNNSEEIIKKILGKKSVPDTSNSEQEDTAVCKPAEPPPRINGNVNGSPVFKDARRQDATRIEDNKKPSTLKLINEKFVEKSVQLLISPPKPQQTDWGFRNKGQLTPKRAKNNSKFNSGNRSPSTPLKSSNSKETDASSSGGKKLTQTKLNIDCFKQKSPMRTKNPENENDERISKRSRMISAEDDDIIFDSPKRQNQVLENIKEEKCENESRCLDETFISSPAIRQFNLGQNNLVEEIRSNQPTCKRSREKSPEYDSVPFVYKREAVRKKEERMKLPGHACIECDKYYKNALGDVDAKDLEKILNKCSRHRDKNPPALDDTPPGYWKPYLTCTTIFTQKKDDAR